VSPIKPVVSGQRLIKASEVEGWEVARRHGSHVRLKKAGHRLALVVPLHKELRKGALAGVLRDAHLGPNDLRRCSTRSPAVALNALAKERERKV
jgi:predicted RNA binding protein YcfA (HicA-like mRNA interferase family)